jgi:hypothetical protein
MQAERLRPFPCEESHGELGIIPVERIQPAIYVIRGKKVLLDRDLALLYAIPTMALKQAVADLASRWL